MISRKDLEDQDQAVNHQEDQEHRMHQSQVMDQQEIEEPVNNIHTQKEQKHDQIQMGHPEIDQVEIDQVDQDQEDPLHRQNQATIRSQNQQQVEINQDPNIEFDIMPDNDIPQRVTRSKNNISKKNMKYQGDYVALLLEPS